MQLPTRACHVFLYAMVSLADTFASSMYNGCSGAGLRRLCRLASMDIVMSSVGGTRKFYDTQVYNPADGALGHLDVSFSDCPTTVFQHRFVDRVQGPTCVICGQCARDHIRSGVQILMTSVQSPSLRLCESHKWHQQQKLATGDTFGGGVCATWAWSPHCHRQNGCRRRYSLR